MDLNRNAPWRWRPTGPPGSLFYAGPRPRSEPETRALLRLVRRVRPAITIWYHQHAALVDDSGGDRRIERRYAQLAGLPLRRYGDLPGVFTGWRTTRSRVHGVRGRAAGRILDAARAARRHAARSSPSRAEGRPRRAGQPPSSTIGSPTAIRPGSTIVP